MHFWFQRPCFHLSIGGLKKKKKVETRGTCAARGQAGPVDEPVCVCVQQVCQGNVRHVCGRGELIKSLMADKLLCLFRFLLAGRRAAEVETPHALTRTAKVRNPLFIILMASSSQCVMPSLRWSLLGHFHEFHFHVFRSRDAALTDLLSSTFSCDVHTLLDTQEVLYVQQQGRNPQLDPHPEISCFASKTRSGCKL